MILRLLRLLRVLKMVKALPKLQIIISGIIGAMKSIVYVAILLILQFYLWAVIGMLLFGENDPVYFGSLEITLYTLFQVCNIEF